MSAKHRLYLLDIEGTVAPISLVTEHLFPYARRNFPGSLARSRGDAAVRADLALLAEENRAETANGIPRLAQVNDPAEVESPRFRLDAMVYFTWLMDRDRKPTALKSLQGKIWKTGFESGDLKGTLFPDVPSALTRWSAEAKVAIYSSGSAEAQQLIFRYSNFGDLTPLISSYFDTRIGSKKESASYAAIATAMNVTPAEAIFFSDVVAELDAARTTGMETRLVIREGNAAIDDAHIHERIRAFDGI